MALSPEEVAYANIISMLEAYEIFGSQVKQDITFERINDDVDNSITSVSFPNIAKFQDQLNTEMSQFITNGTTERNDLISQINQAYTDFQTQINTDYGTFTQSVIDGAISATNIKYVNGKAYDKNDNEILVLPSVPTLDEVITAIDLKNVDGVLKDGDDNVIPTQKTKEEVLADTNIQFIDGAIVDKDGNIIPIEGGSSLKSTILYDSNDVGTYIPGETWDEHPTYSRTHQYTKGQFAVSTNTFDNKNQMKVEMRIAPFQVNQETGQMTWGNFGYGYRNSGGYAHSTQSFGFCGNIGMAWGNSCWGTDNTHRQGGCSWRVNDNNTVTQGGNTGNTAYTYSENTSNGMLALQEYNGRVYFHIPTHNGSSKASANGGYIDETDASFDSKPSLTGGYIPTSTTTTCYIWRCIGKEVGQNKAGLFNYTNSSPKLVALTATGNNSYSGNTLTVSGSVREGIGFELESGEQIYTSSIGTFVRESETGGIATCSIDEEGAGVSLSSGINVKSNMSYYTGGYPAKEQDTFYVLDSSGVNFTKIKFTKVSTGNYTVTTLGSMDITSLRGRYGIDTYDGLLDVTGSNDQFLVVSARYTSYQPTYTIVVDNPMKDL